MKSASFSPNMHNLHVPIPADMRTRLRREAEQSGLPATEIARLAISDWLERAEILRIETDIASFAKQFAGTELDLDQGFEQAGVKFLESDGSM
jgi:hypothetical protein